MDPQRYERLKRLIFAILRRSHKGKVYVNQLCDRCMRAYREKTGITVQFWEIEQILDDLILENPPQLKKDQLGNFSIVEHPHNSKLTEFC